MGQAEAMSINKKGNGRVRQATGHRVKDIISVLSAAAIRPPFLWLSCMITTAMCSLGSRAARVGKRCVEWLSIDGQSCGGHEHR